jgi:mono/diheme cytochrome c family protein
MSRLSVFILIVGCLGVIAPAAEIANAPAPKPADHAIVSGFDRFFASPESSTVDGGLLLLGELNCTSCHAASKELDGVLLKKQAPYLGEIAHRADPKFLAKFIASTHTVKPGSTMPSLLASLSPEEATSKATALAHYLASLGKQPFTRVAPELTAVTRGEALFHNAGCVACHAPRLERAAKASDDEDETEVALLDLNAASIPLSRKLHEKYSLSGLTTFLQNPLAHRPSGRMPNLNLKPNEAADIAQYLLKDTVAPAPLTMKFYEGKWTKMPDFSKLKPKSSGPVSGISIDGFKNRDNFAVEFEGFLRIEKAGEYVFFVTSDDGAQIFVDGELVTNNDGIHPEQESKGKINLEPGLHKFRVAYFEAGGGEELKVTWQTKGLPRQSISNAVLTNSDKPAPNEEAWKTDSTLAQQGAELFVSLSCANCHQLGPKEKNPVGKPAKSLAELAGAGGCLDSKPAAGHPYYQLSAQQVTALTRALQSIKTKSLPQRTPAEQIHIKMAALNCYACHKRGDLGGVIRERDPYFTANSPDLGDEGRLPPPLTGVGDKLLPEAFTAILTKAAVARPYMDARMPQFGAANLGKLAELITQHDLKQTPIPQVADDVKKLKNDGHKIVGKEGLTCISCHMFNRNKSLGIQAMDLTLVHDRIRPEWFHKYLQNPSEFRPGTRMPQAFVNGKSTLTTVLDGNADRQIQALWQFLADGRKAKNPVGVIPTGLELVVGGEALMYRNFITGAGPRAIGVGYPEDVNLAFDANHPRLALIWQGKFIDGAKHWEGRGQGYQDPLGDHLVKLPPGPELAALASPDEAWPKSTEANSKDPNFRFHGYELDDVRRPAFLYEMLGQQPVMIRDYPVGAGTFEDRRIVRTLTFTSPAATDKLFFRIAAGKLEPEANGYRVNGEITCTVKGAKPITRGVDKAGELLLPLKLEANKPHEVQIEYRW